MFHENQGKNGLVSGNDGFTFIEIVIALCVFSIGVLGVTMMQTTAISGNVTAMNNTAAVAFASDQMEKVLGMSYSDLENGSSTEGPYSVTWTVDDAVNNKKGVHVTIVWSDKGHERTITYSMIRNVKI